MKKLIILSPTIIGCFIGYLMWGPLRAYLYGLLPVNAYTGIMKIVVLLLVGYFGGVAIPVIGLGMSVVLWAQD